VGVIALVSISLFSTSSRSFGAGSPDSGPSLKQLLSYVDASSQLKRGPNVSTSIPSLTEAGNDSESVTPYECVSVATTPEPIPSSAVSTCVLGDKKATRTIFLFGDSQAQMWVPAFNVVGTALKWKIVFIAKDGCGPWISPVTNSQGSSACNQWVHSAIALVNQLKPQVVVPVGLSLSMLSNNQYPLTDQFVSEVQSMIHGIEPSHAKILLLQEIPQFYSYFTTATPESCLTVHSSSIQNCELTIKQIKTIETTVGLNEVATMDHLPTVPTRELFCGRVRCDVFVDSSGESHLVYQDWAHMNATYSAWIGQALAQLLSKYLPTS